MIEKGLEAGRWIKDTWYSPDEDPECTVSFDLPARDLSILEESDLWKTLLQFLGCCQNTDNQMSQQEKKELLETAWSNKQYGQPPDLSTSQCVLNISLALNCNDTRAH